MKLTEAEYVASIKATATIMHGKSFEKNSGAAAAILGGILDAVSKHKKENKE